MLDGQHHWRRVPHRRQQQPRQTHNAQLKLLSTRQRQQGVRVKPLGASRPPGLRFCQELRMADKRCRPVRLQLLRLKLHPRLIMDGEHAKPLSGLLLVLLSLQGQAKSRLPTWCTALLALGWWHMATQ
jgi:hypothetical protein